MKFGIREKIIAGIAVIVLIIVGWFFLYYSPQQAAITRMERETEDILRRINVASSSSSQINELKDEIARLTEDLREKQSKIIPKDSLLFMENELRKLAQENKLEIVSIVPEHEALFQSDTSLIIRLPITMELKGKFFDFGNFLENMRELPFMIQESEVAMRTDDDLYPVLMIVLKSYGYVSNF